MDNPSLPSTSRALSVFGLYSRVVFVFVVKSSGSLSCPIAWCGQDENKGWVKGKSASLRLG